MKSDFLKQLTLAAKIWSVAAGVNSALISLIFFITSGPIGALSMFVLLAIISAVFSIPCLVVVFCIIRLFATVLNGKWLFGCIMAGGILSAVVIVSALHNELGEGDKFVATAIWVTGIAAAIAGVTTMYKSILQWGYERCPNEKV